MTGAECPVSISRPSPMRRERDLRRAWDIGNWDLVIGHSGIENPRWDTYNRHRGPPPGRVLFEAKERVAMSPTTTPLTSRWQLWAVVLLAPVLLGVVLFQGV